ncbi:MAG: hypothetical protein ACI9K2_004204 [Myxococcota bacterium]
MLRWSFLMLAACAKQPGSPATPSPASVLQVQLPAEAGAPDFARTLIGHPVTDWSPTGDRSFLYDTLTMAPDGSFSAAAHLAAGGETVPCTEAGTWSVEAVESETAGTIGLALAQTDCATRSAGTELRLRISREGDRYSISYR